MRDVASHGVMASLLLLLVKVAAVSIVKGSHRHLSAPLRTSPISGSLVPVQVGRVVHAGARRSSLETGTHPQNKNIPVGLLWMKIPVP